VLLKRASPTFDRVVSGLPVKTPHCAARPVTGREACSLIRLG
jgi:hypothetical protein